jgi:hypothetical protein
MRIYLSFVVIFINNVISLNFIKNRCNIIKKQFMRPFEIEENEIRSPIIVTNDTLLNEIEGFYGLIGPEVNKSSIKTLYGLFTGDGIIQGVFFDKGNMRFVKHFVRTEKILFESVYGRFSTNLLMTPLYVFLNKIGFIPNTLGLANTALIDIDKKTFAFFERDKPYELDINNNKQTIKTIKKENIKGVEHLSGHSVYEKGLIHTIDYDIISNKVYYIQLNNDFTIHSKSTIKTKYIPLIHDFVLLPQNKILFIDTPFKWDLSSMFSEYQYEEYNSRYNEYSLLSKLCKKDINFFNNPLLSVKSPPVLFDNLKPTYISIYDKETNSLKQWESPESFYMFHCAYIDENMNMYAPVYDSIDFSSTNISGKYRMFSLMESGEVFITKNMILEDMNLDFPIKWKEYIILRSIENLVINGFIVCNGLTIVRDIRLTKDRFFCGEPSIIEIKDEPYLLGLSYDETGSGYISLIGIFNDEYREHPLNSDLTIGFHSLFK